MSKKESNKPSPTLKNNNQSRELALMRALTALFAAIAIAAWFRPTTIETVHVAMETKEEPNQGFPDRVGTMRFADRLYARHEAWRSERLVNLISSFSFYFLFCFLC